jgi:hypothetical protein
MGKGRDLGLQLRRWLDDGVVPADSGTALANRLIDGLGADDSLKAPIRDLASRPLLAQVLRQRGAAQRSALQALIRDLSTTYTTRVMEELGDLLEAATGVAPMPRGGAGMDPSDGGPGRLPPDSGASMVPPGSGAGMAGTPEAAGLADQTLPPRAAERAPSPPVPSSAERRLARRKRARNRHTPAGRLQAAAATVRAIAPGLALAFATTLVLSWGAGEADRWVLEPNRWRGSWVLVGALLVAQVLANFPFRRWRWQAPLHRADATDPRQSWRWITAPWVHHRNGEGWLNALLLLMVLGTSPLALADGVLRYCLTALATMASGAMVALWRTEEQAWDGASGAVSALITLAAALSLLQWRVISFAVGAVRIPAWVPLLVYGAVQLGWILPRRDEEDSSTPWDRLFSSQWFWGSVLGVSWAVITWGGRLIEELQRNTQTG